MAITKRGRKSKRAKYYIANKEKVLEYQAKYNEANKEKILEYQAKYRADNKEKLSEYQAKYCADNKEKLLEYQAKYNEANKEKVLRRSVLDGMCKRTNLKPIDIPQELIDLKLKQLQMKRVMYANS